MAWEWAGVSLMMKMMDSSVEVQACFSKCAWEEAEMDFNNFSSFQAPQEVAWAT